MARLRTVRMDIPRIHDNIIRPGRPAEIWVDHNTIRAKIKILSMSSHLDDQSARKDALWRHGRSEQRRERLNGLKILAIHPLSELGRMSVWPRTKNGRFVNRDIKRINKKLGFTLTYVQAYCFFVSENHQISYSSKYFIELARCWGMIYFK